MALGLNRSFTYLNGYYVGTLGAFGNGDWGRWFLTLSGSATNYVEVTYSTNLVNANWMGVLEFRNGTVDGPVMGQVTVGSTGNQNNFQTVKAPLLVQSASVDLYVVLRTSEAGHRDILTLANMRFRGCSSVEPCDDGNPANGDGCTTSCTVENRWVCYGTSEYETSTTRSCANIQSGCGNGSVTWSGINPSLGVDEFFHANSPTHADGGYEILPSQDPEVSGSMVRMHGGGSWGVFGHGGFSNYPFDFDKYQYNMLRLHVRTNDQWNQISVRLDNQNGTEVGSAYLSSTGGQWKHMFIPLGRHISGSHRLALVMGNSSGRSVDMGWGRVYNPGNMEFCDDGNNFNGDGCSAACLPEGGWGGYNNTLCDQQIPTYACRSY